MNYFSLIIYLQLHICTTLTQELQHQSDPLLWKPKEIYSTNKWLQPKPSEFVPFRSPAAVWFTAFGILSQEQRERWQISNSQSCRKSFSVLWTEKSITLPTFQWFKRQNDKKQPSQVLWANSSIHSKPCRKMLCVLCFFSYWKLTKLFLMTKAACKDLSLLSRCACASS